MKFLFGSQSDEYPSKQMRSFRLASRTKKKTNHVLEGLRVRSWIELNKKSVKKLSSCALATGFMVFGSFGADAGVVFSVTDLVGRKQIEHAAEVQAENAQKAFEREEILWFARALRSETDLESEKWYIAWAIRNRVQNTWYPDTYKEVVLQPYQFSGLNDFDYHYERNMTRDFDTVDDPVWQKTLEIAQEVYYADESERMLPSGVMHFYSPVAVGTPDWAQGLTPVKELRGRAGVRFAFYQGVK